MEFCATDLLINGCQYSIFRVWIRCGMRQNIRSLAIETDKVIEIGSAAQREGL